jgi:hypothetical protein
MLQENLKRMATEVLIPVTPAPPDPEWLMKKKAGRKLEADEQVLYHVWKHD